MAHTADDVECARFTASLLRAVQHQSRSGIPRIDCMGSGNPQRHGHRAVVIGKADIATQGVEQLAQQLATVDQRRVGCWN